MALEIKKNHKVIRIQTHVGVHVAGNCLTALDSSKHGFKMELHPAGVLVDYKNSKGERGVKIVTYANIQEMDLDTSEQTA